jgi:cytochrome c oxidase assembly protein subunit 15
MDSASLVDLEPLARLAGLAIVIAVAPLAWLWLRHRGAEPAARRRALVALTLFLTFDLVLFGAFTRLTDSGLGCPDWPGCYGNASPIGARAEIGAAQSAMPTGPVTHRKAWIEMIHRYLAMAVGLLILVTLVASAVDAWRRRPGHGLALALATFVWVCVQGAFGALTVTLKLQPAIVTLHLLGGIALLVLLTMQLAATQAPLAVPRAVRRGVIGVAALLVVQIALGGWVSTNYAVLACTEFPRCQGAWWPAMDFAAGFEWWRPLGRTGDGAFLPFAALTAIHYTHRLVAYGVLAALVALAIVLVRRAPAARRFAGALGALAVLQLASGLGNVVLGWPLVAAVLHTAGAAALMALLVALAVRSRPQGGAS